MTFLSWLKPQTSTENRPGERGAIMVMGVFLACSMIAAMWYMMGIGDAILWRDRQQEAADSIAFTSAAIHARGMNFIAMVNIVMMFIIAVYLIACLIRTVLDMILYVTGDPTEILCEPFLFLSDTEGHGALQAISQIAGFIAGGGDPPRYTVNAECGGGILDLITQIEERAGDNAAGRDWALNADCTVALSICCLGNHPLETIADKVAPMYTKLESFIIKYEENVMRNVLPPMHGVEVLTALATPWIGTAVSYFVGTDYKEKPSGQPTMQIEHKGGALSPSLFRRLKKPKEVKELNVPEDKWIKCAKMDDCGNGCGPTLCNNGMVSRSGPRKKGTSGSDAECCKMGTTGCTLSGTCSRNGGVAADQSSLYVTKTIDDSKDFRIGLPVQAENMNMLCEKAFEYLGDAIQGLLSNLGLPGMNQKSKTWPGKKSTGQTAGGMLDSLFNAVGGWFKKAYCTYDPAFSAGHSLDGYHDVFPKNGSYQGGSCDNSVCQGSCPDDSNDFWAINDGSGDKQDRCPFDKWEPGSLGFLYDGKHRGGQGPMKVVDYAPNGGDYNQVYGFVLNTYYNPKTAEYGTANNLTAWSKIRLAVGPVGQNATNAQDESQYAVTNNDIFAYIVGGQGNGPWFYISEAEFYHDCDSEWDDKACNGGDHAMYRLNWRTRLRRIHQPVYIRDLVNSNIRNAISSVGGWVTSHQWLLNKFLVDLGGSDFSNIFNLIETITELGTNDPNGLMKPLYH